MQGHTGGANPTESQQPFEQGASGAALAESPSPGIETPVIHDK
jgi:hypothetical protein